MMRHLRLARGLLAVGVVQPLMVRACAATSGLCGVALIVDVSLAGLAIAPVLLLQLFASASGFAIPARRGHYDLALTRGESRLRIGLMHWFLSASPGVASWLALAGLEAVCGGAALRTSGTMVGVLLVSTIPWAANTELPRLSAAIIWLVGAALAAIVTPSDPSPVLGLARPWELGGASWNTRDTLSVWTAAGALVFGTMAVALRRIDRMDVPLESAQ